MAVSLVLALAMALVVVPRACTAGAGAAALSFTTAAAAVAPFDVLVYGSTPGGVMAAVAAARHGARTALLSQRAHIGGVCAGGLGQTDIGSCADEVIGGLALEFFNRSAAAYATRQPRAPWNLEPHVAKRTFLAMLNESGVVLLPPDQVAAAPMAARVRAAGTAGAPAPALESVRVEGGTVYRARVFVDASYEGDLMARASGVDYTSGREAMSVYNEPGAGSQGPAQPQAYGIEYMDPFDGGGAPLPLLSNTPPKPKGEGDRLIQAYNFRLCVTDNSTLRVPFAKPPGYDASEWELLRRFWKGWVRLNSTSMPKEPTIIHAAQAKVPSAILGAIPSSTGARKFDANNCGFNPIHTDMIGGSVDYPEANYSHRASIWEAHVNYTKGFLWFMSSDASVPPPVRSAYADVWGYCGDEFAETGHFPPQLYIREARRLVGDAVFTQLDAENKTDIGNLSLGMGCYNFDSHCTKRFACTEPECTLYNKSYVSLQCGVAQKNPGVYQMPLSLLLPKRRQVSNLLVPVCSSASHVAYATVRMEPQFMILGHAAGVVAALTVKAGAAAAVQDVDPAVLAATLRADGQLLHPPAVPPPPPPAPPPITYGCQAGAGAAAEARCLLYPTRAAAGKGSNSTCGGACSPLAANEWLANAVDWYPPSPALPHHLRSHSATVLKKSEAVSWHLPAWAVQAVGQPGGRHAVSITLVRPPVLFDTGYYLVACAHTNCSEADPRANR